MCLTKLTYYSCNCLESKKEVLCRLPKPACPENLKFPETKNLEKACPHHSRGASDNAPTVQQRWSPARETRPNNITFHQQPLATTLLSPVSPISEFKWPSSDVSNSHPVYPSQPYPTRYPSYSQAPTGNRSGSGSGRHPANSGHRQSSTTSTSRRATPSRNPGMSANITNAMFDLNEINMPGRNRDSMYNLNSLCEHQARNPPSPPPPVPALPAGSGFMLHRTNNANKARQPARIDTNVWHLNSKRTEPQAGAVAKPRSPKSRISPRTAALAQQQALVRSYREALSEARRWTSTLHGPWTSDAFCSQPCIANLNPSDQQALWTEFQQRQRRGHNTQRSTGAFWGRGGGGGGGQNRDHHTGRSKKSNQNGSSSPGCEVM